MLASFCPEEELSSFSASSFSVYGHQHAIVDEISDPVFHGGRADPQEFGLLHGGEGDHGRAGALQGDLGHNAETPVKLQDLPLELPVAT